MSSWLLLKNTPVQHSNLRSSFNRKCIKSAEGSKMLQNAVSLWLNIPWVLLVQLLIIRLQRVSICTECNRRALTSHADLVTITPEEGGVKPWWSYSVFTSRVMGWMIFHFPVFNWGPNKDVSFNMIKQYLPIC